MLIDATHLEETRVAVVEGNRLDDFDYESKVRKQLKGSIFLAKVTRVEPSLQAAFVNFGGNRHGFLPFTEIHPDYYRIPIADREALLAEQQREMEALLAEEEERDRALEAEEARANGKAENDEDTGIDESEVIEIHDGVREIRNEDEGDEPPEAEEVLVHVASRQDQKDENGEEPYVEEGDVDGNVKGEEPSFADDENGDPYQERGRHGGRGRGRNGRRGYAGRGGRGGGRMAARNRRPEMVDGDDHGGEEGSPGRFSLRKSYKIQEVIKRGQIMLVQVSKEERGNKGAAVSTYLSLPGRYCVLMPNSPRGGGVSRKIANFKERKRMREILSELNVPSGMSVIMRTAGMSRTKVEIKRDLDYLMKLWDSIRELTLSSTAPALVHEEGNLIRRSIRDIYASEIEELIVSGETGYKFARDFMKMMIPSHAKRVKEYKDEKIPLFHRYQIENQISAIGEPVVTLPSGGYLVINPTEALVSIDVNSGKATKERHIEETALRTNLEAADEVARQLRLRDLGGLVVVDFIDMEDRRNNRKVENRMRDALSGDRARIQVGRISSFGLLELSRQRLNPSLTEAQHEKCAHCQGVGHVRTIDATAITVMRALEEEGIRGRADQIILHLSTTIALYILNNKRHMLDEIEKRYGFSVKVDTEGNLPQSQFLIEPVKSNAPRQEEDMDTEVSEESDSAVPAEKAAQGDFDRPERGNRRRGRRGGRRRNGQREEFPGEESGRHERQGEESADEGETVVTAVSEPETPEATEETPKLPAKRGRKSASKPPKDESADAELAEGRQKKGRKETVKTETNAQTAEENVGVSEAAVAVASVTPARASNDEIPPRVKDYEVVNQPPAQKKKGWWKKSTE